ncbi:hypothetical protein TVAG_297170 [Trichomonas vaginalis G3]|uniref:Uncharacterized protein n=1 Tax=Trichomonas vaginalis (strain ATCC PRA-98 / G3) TaxID=412133 RepID=A2DRB2_TRIV3|nr:hypothetical protein TVAGG3_0512750 [Trichomonas vaginalis G3]EAY17038.1 hypothetical protein TVAG_297170 [Trichomonas vaginalis G3]KAI5517901.1 hypothetical protein TVAGG3_0512750 [Trichomonas vaginalis G3]|eukprot:XP_001329261.1 hypothetical protein [Trichomonas vaginalis G3]
MTLDSTQINQSIDQIKQWVKTSTKYDPSEISSNIDSIFRDLVETIAQTIRKKLSDYELQIANLNCKHSELEQKNDSLEDEISKLKGDSQKLKSFMAYKKVAFSQDNFDLSHKNESSTPPPQPKSPTPPQPSSPKQSSPQVNVAKLTARMQSLELQIESLSNENQKLIAEINDSNNKHNTYVQQLLFDHEQKENEYKEKLSKLTLDSGKFQKQLETATSTISKKDERIENLKGILSRKDTELVNLKSRIIDAEETIKELQEMGDENKKLYEINKSLEENRAREKLNYQTSARLVKAECDDKVQILTKKLAAVENALNDTLSQKNSLESSILEAQENSKSVLHESKMLLKKVGELEGQNSSLKNEISELNSKNSSLMSEIQHLSQLSNDHIENSPSKPQNSEISTGSPQKSFINREISKEVMEISRTNNEKTENNDQELVDKLKKSLSLLKVDSKLSNTSELADQLISTLENQPKTENFDTKEIFEILGPIIKRYEADAASSNSPSMVLRNTQKRFMNLLSKFNDARDVIKSVRSIVESSEPDECHHALRTLFGVN